MTDFEFQIDNNFMLYCSSKNLSKKTLASYEQALKLTSCRSDQASWRNGLLNHMFDVYLERCGLLERSADGAKLEGQHSCHSLRHTFCKGLANKGVPIERIKELAGHDSIQTTAIYVQSSGHDLRKAVS